MNRGYMQQKDVPTEKFRARVSVARVTVYVCSPLIILLVPVI